MDTVQIIEGSKTTQLVLGANMEITMAQALYEQLTTVLIAQREMILDASQVVRVDAAALQTLACFCRSARARAIPFQWTAVSTALEQAAEQLGLASVLFGER